MLLPQTKEREYRFLLALRIGLPIFGLVLALIFHTFISNQETLGGAFYFEAILLLAFSIYFIFYLIHSGFSVKITDDISKTFTREYLYTYLNKELKKKTDYTLILIAVDNLSDINTQYGMKNGDRVLKHVVMWVAEYLKSQDIKNYPFGHIKGGDFVIGLEGVQAEYNTILELMCLKSNEFKVDNIEVNISGAITDSSYSRDLGYMIENLFELQKRTVSKKRTQESSEITPNELEFFVINAIHDRSLQISSQDVYEGEKVAFKECFIKLKTRDDKLLYPKTYLKVINKLGLGLEYDLMVLEQITLLCKDKKSVLAINISPTSLRNENFLIRAKNILKDTETRLMFILSETEYFSHTSRYNYIINSLRSSGVLIAIDRLASLHTSFLYLRELDIDVVRFDTYYSKELKLEQNRNIIEGFNLMAKQKGVKSWIKNLEEESSLELAATIGMDYTQGKILSELNKVYES